MEQWEFEIVHRRGKVHELPDALSRAYEANEEVCVAGVRDESDEEHQRLVEDVTQNPQRWQNWRVESGNLYHYRYDPLFDPITDCEEGWKLVVPPAQRERVMRDAHDITSAGHLGIERPSIASSTSITGMACITTCTNTSDHEIRASATRSIRLVRATPVIRSSTSYSLLGVPHHERQDEVRSHPRKSAREVQARDVQSSCMEDHVLIRGTDVVRTTTASATAWTRRLCLCSNR
ncbi:unnamed protein product [Trichogramma brassicae]|uniref:Integrase zinc-binding domain-containing protein n=1 Tax=Trichogramma brassicae TaxID=86971 RepID=A0A6H5IVR9_9HYME|nr:unnamed protein product [Trichogramma brassicae]